MKIPAFLYGTYADVKKRCQRKLKVLAKGTPLAEIVEDTWLDPLTTEGLIMMDGPIATVQGSNFHCYVLTREAISNPVFRASNVWQRLHQEGLERLWMLLGFQSALSSTFAERTPSWQRPFLAAMVRHWAEIDALGKRYSLGTSSAREFWNLTTTTKFVLGQLGLPIERVKQPLPPGGLPALARAVELPTLS